jgi:mannitol 2-dehydrogenase
MTVRRVARPVPLRAATLPEIADHVPVPTYDRSAVRTGIVHIGVGGFHRAHQAMYLDVLMNDARGFDWGITGVGMLPADKRMAEVMAAQDCLYTLVLKHPDGTLEPRVVGSMVDYLFAPEQGQAVLDRMTDPRTRVVSLTVTEGGYHVNQVTGDFDPDDAGIQHDLATEGLPTTAFGFVVEALSRRRANGTPPFTLMSCDNNPGNGQLARAMITAFATLRDPELAGWIADEVAFPNSMVDRITPVTTDHDRAQLAEQFGIEDGWPVVSEAFTQWALEDRFSDGRPPLEEAGVQVIDDVEPYELMKLRLLNASHQAMCYLGVLAGHTYAHEACADPLFVRFLLGYMTEEAIPTLSPVPGVDLETYRHQLIERFANPEIKDTLARLCAEGSERIPRWLVPVVLERLAAGGRVDRAALVIAAWARYAEGVDEQGRPLDIVDRRKEQLMARARRQSEDPLAFLRDRDLFGDLVDDGRFTEPYLAGLQMLHKRGAMATIRAWEGRTV